MRAAAAEAEEAAAVPADVLTGLLTTSNNILEKQNILTQEISHILLVVDIQLLVNLQAMVVQVAEVL